MKVAAFTHYGAFAYGSNRSLVNLLDGLASYNAEIKVVYPSGGSDRSLATELGVRGIPAIEDTVAWWMSTKESRRQAFARLVQNMRCVPRLAHCLKKWGCEVIYTNSSVLPTGAMVAAYAGLPHVWHIREFGDLDYQLRHDWGVHIFRWVVDRAAAKVTVSSAVRSYVLPGELARRSHVIYNGVAFRHEFDGYRTHRNVMTRNHGEFTFAVVGLVAPWKGQEEAILALGEVAKAERRVRLLIAGGSYQDQLEKCRDLAKSLGLADKVDFLGYVDDPYDVYFQTDAVLVCSRNEGMGRVTVEAMSACCPVIGFDAAGTSELITDGENGLLYRNGAEDLARCMLRCVTNANWTQQLGLYGWYVARERYTIEKYAEEVHGVFQSVRRAS